MDCTYKYKYYGVIPKETRNNALSYRENNRVVSCTVDAEWI
jgi:hypothetical protein